MFFVNFYRLCMNYSLTHNLCRLVYEGQMHYPELNWGLGVYNSILAPVG